MSIKVLQINVVYKIGSTGKLVCDLHTFFTNKGMTSVVCYGRKKMLEETNVYKIAPEWIMKLQSFQSKVTGYAYAGCLISTHNLIKMIQRENPNIVHLHCLNGYFVNIYRLLDFLKNNNFKTVLTLHAEFMYTAGCSHSFECEQWKVGCCTDNSSCSQFNKARPRAWFFNQCSHEWRLMKNAFSGFEEIVICSVSDWLKGRAIQSPFLRNKKIMTIPNGIDVDVFKPVNFSELKKRHNLRDEKIILHVTPDFLSELKGGKYILDLANRHINDNVKVIIVGFNGDLKKLPINIIPISHTFNQYELAAYYSMADITVLTSKKETFSMVCAESLACGTPVVGFRAGGPETISLKKYSEFVRQGDMEALDGAVKKWLNGKQKYGVSIFQEAKKAYSHVLMCEKYLDVYIELLKDR